jgi:hypothetical protein
VGEDFLPILTRFHREVIAPEMRRVVSEAVDALEGRMNAHFDAIYKRFDRLETEYQMLVAGDGSSVGTARVEDARGRAPGSSPDPRGSTRPVGG